MQEQLQVEAKLKMKLLVRCKGLCEECHQPPDWRGLSKHEVLSRAQGGDPTDESNCLMLCGRCHSKEHGVKEV